MHHVCESAWLVECARMSLDDHTKSCYSDSAFSLPTESRRRTLKAPMACRYLIKFRTVPIDRLKVTVITVNSTAILPILLHHGRNRPRFCSIRTDYSQIVGYSTVLDKCHIWSSGRADWHQPWNHITHRHILLYLPLFYIDSTYLIQFNHLIIIYVFY